MIQVNHLSQQVRRLLLDDIVAGRLRSGATLRENDLASQLQVSRTPIREALRSLASDGFVEITPNRGAVVRSLDPAQLRQVYQVREALEAMAAELACGRLTEADVQRLAELRQAVQQSSAADYPARCHAYDVDLHRTIASRADNPILAREIERFHDLVQLVRHRVGDRDGALGIAFQQHNAIVAALVAGDAAQCRRAMLEHIRTTRDLAVGCLSASTED